MAIQDFYEPLIMMDKKSISDGMGGFEITWVDGAEFLGSVNTDNSTEMRIAEQQGVTSVYTITTERNLILNHGDVVKRKRDNKTFKITSNSDDMQSPARPNSRINITQVRAESFDLI